MAASLPPGHERAPLNPLPPGPRPGRPYKVKTGDGWRTVAKANSITVAALIANNCGEGAAPEEVNWYLHIRIGCDVTKDAVNWAFSDSAKPGLIFIPNASAAVRANQDPKVNSLYGDPKDLGCGGMRWLVGFELPEPAGADGWIIQRIVRSYDVRQPDGSASDPSFNGTRAPFWEAWPVRKGETETSNRYDTTDEGVTYDDSFDQPSRPGRRGTFKVEALAKFFEGALPLGFMKENPATRAMDLPSSATKPFFWDDTGTARSMAVDWDCTKPNASQKTNIVTRVWRKA